MKTKVFNFKFILRTFLGLMFPLMLMGCTEKHKAETLPPVLKVDTPNLKIVQSGGGTVVPFIIENPVSNEKVKAVTNADWISDIKTEINESKGKLTFNVSANENPAKRETTMVLSYADAEDLILNITQAAAEKDDEIEALKFTTSVVGVYQQAENSLTDFYLILTTCPYTIDDNSQVVLEQEGYIASIDLYAVAEDMGIIPSGDYLAAFGAEISDMTFDTDYTSVIYQDRTGINSQVPYAIDSNLTVEYKSGEYYIHSTYKTREGSIPFEYRGKLTLTEVPDQGGALPLIGHDVNVDGFKAIATYFGNLLESGTGMMAINIMDRTYAEDETKGQGGYAVSLMVFSQLFPQTNMIKLIPGTYEVNTEFKKGTWLPGIEINAMGSVIPFGTYAHCDDGSNMGKFLFAGEGTVTIEETETGYKILYDLESQDGYKITGSYDGFVEISDQSNDESKDDGTSTLTDDHDMDLSAIKTARLFSLGDVEDNEGTIHTHNRIDIGSRSGWDMEEVLKKGDTFTMDLVMEHDAAGKIVPGTYKVTEDRFPVSMVPGAAIRGYIWSGEYMGTGWLGFNTEKPQDLYLYGHAAAYGGEITIEKSDLGENYYTFTIDITCVRKMHVRGTWTGPVINANDSTPVLPSTAANRKAADTSSKLNISTEKMQAAAKQIKN